MRRPPQTARACRRRSSRRGGPLPLLLRSQGLPGPRPKVSRKGPARPQSTRRRRQNPRRRHAAVQRKLPKPRHPAAGPPRLTRPRASPGLPPSPQRSPQRNRRRNPGSTPPRRSRCLRFCRPSSLRRLQRSRPVRGGCTSSSSTATECRRISAPPAIRQARRSAK